MVEAAVIQAKRSAVSYLVVPEDATPYLEGAHCQRCGVTYAGHRLVCAKCFGRDTIVPVRLAETGTLYTYTIVYRSFPGIKTPFVAVIVDLDGGGTIPGTLIDVTPDPAYLPFGMPVRVVFQDTGQRDADGAAYIAPVFTPLNRGSGEIL